MHRGCLSLLLVLAVLAIVAALAGCSSPNPRQVTRIVLQVAPKPGSQWLSSPGSRKAILEHTRMVLLRRAATLDINGEPSVDVEGGSRLVVGLPELLNEPKAVRVLTGGGGTLEFYWLKDVYTTTNPLGKWRMDVIEKETRSVTFTGPRGEVLDSGNPVDQPKILAQVVGAPREKPVLTGANLLPNAKAALKTGTSFPMIEIEFDRKGTEIFRDFTGAHVGEVLAVFCDGKLLTAPTIRDKISDGKAIIEGFPSLREATRIASYLNSGALPVALKVVEVRK